MADTKDKALLPNYSALLGEVKERIQAAQTRAAASVNRELIRLYWEIGRMISERQDAEGWGAKVIDRLAADLANELPEVKGFSARNLKRMKAFFAEYRLPPGTSEDVQVPTDTGSEKVPRLAAPDRGTNRLGHGKGPQLAAQFASVILDLPWMHHALLIEKVKDADQRLWYMRQTIEHGWSRGVLQHQIGSRAHERTGQAISNFSRTLPPPQSDLAQQSLKDPYVFDFLTLTEPFRERELETALVRHLQDFLVELGVGFAFVGRQYRVEAGDEDFYIDLLFYHLALRCYVVIELKRGPFRPEYAGKLNFYLNVIDDRLRHPQDNPTIGLILCQEKKKVVAEYALRGLDKAIGVSEYELTRVLPESIKSNLPAIEEIEAELESAKEATDQ
jgi:predicted nuclease of restriction endonuclease-like (RecB) superfamily